MKKIKFIFLIFFFSCSSIPKGSDVMKEGISVDKEEQQNRPKLNLKEKVGTKIQVIRSYAKVDENNIMNLESIYLVPYQEKKINWNEVEVIMEGDNVK
jgi:hypothetical protein